MVYPNPFKAVSRKLTNNIVVAASSFKRFGKVNFGARMAYFHYDGEVVVWSAMPYGDDTVKALQLLTGKPDADVSYLIIPDKEHTMAAKLFKEKYPALKIIAMEGLDLGIPIDYQISAKYAHKLLNKEVLQEIGIADPVILNNFEFVFLPQHANQELVMYDLNSKTVFEADLLFNLRADEPLEQFSPALGFEERFNVLAGWSAPSKYLNPDSKIGRYLFNKLANSSASAEGLRNIYNWEFDRLVMCHGNIIESGAKAEFKKVFDAVL